jgi:ABC-type branched-subunit amino acid transport system permease subunit
MVPNVGLCRNMNGENRVMGRWRRESSLDIYQFVLGLFLVMAPWAFAFGYKPARVDATVSGILMLVLSAAALVAFTEWEEWAALALGLWISISPWVLHFPNLPAIKIYVITGVLIFYLAGLELWLMKYGTGS